MMKFKYEYANRDSVSAAGWIAHPDWDEARQWLDRAVKFNGGWGWVEHPTTLERHAVNCVLPRTKPRYTYRHLWRCSCCGAQTSAPILLMDGMLTDDLDHRHLRIAAVTEIAYCRLCETAQQDMEHLGIFPDTPGGLQTAGWYEARIDLPEDYSARLTRIYASDAKDAYVELRLLAGECAGDVYCNGRRIAADGTLLDE